MLFDLLKYISFLFSTKIILSDIISEIEFSINFFSRFLSINMGLKLNSLQFLFNNFLLFSFNKAFSP